MLARRANRREVKAGFPVEARAFTAQEIDDYLSGDTITCLMCGREMKQIGTMHLRNIHAMTVDDYRLRYGLPWGRGVQSRSTYELKAKITRDRLEIPEFRDKWNEARAIGAVKNKHKPRPRMPFHNTITRKIGAAFHGREEPYNDSHAEKILACLEAEVPEMVVGKEGNPRATWWYGYLRTHPEFEIRVARAWDAAPFDFAAKHGMLGPRFIVELRKLFDAGLSDHKAAQLLGVTAMTCNKHTKGWR